MTDKEYEDLRLKEYYMMSEEAMKHGFLDEVITLENKNCGILY